MRSCLVKFPKREPYPFHLNRYGFCSKFKTIDSNLNGDHVAAPSIDWYFRTSYYPVFFKGGSC